jgi:isopentenyl diphosphate isomerase/L-lactate dehydrogenase-like FMN-dependent dehydrogenase
VRNKFAMRAGMKLENVFDISSEKAVKVSGSSNANAVDDDDTLVNATRRVTVVRRRATVSATTKNIPSTTTAPSRAQKEIARRVGGRDASLTWSFLEWIKSVTNRPIILKGVTRRDDAAKAVEMGVDALWVSNHGGRQLDGAPATLDALPEVVAGAKSAFLTRRDDSKKKRKVPVVFDGGVRRGVDVLKALALGADLVAFGRPLGGGLACGGEEGVDRVIEVLLDELKTAAALCGVQKLDDRNAFLADVAQRRGDPPPGQKRSRL